LRCCEAEGKEGTVDLPLTASGSDRSSINVRWPAHSRPPLNLRRHKYQQPIVMEMTMTTDAETLVRRAYQLAEGDSMDVQGFMNLFAEDGEINAGTMNFRGDQLGWLVVFSAKFAPDIR